MLFNSYIFVLLFLPLTVSIYFLINKIPRFENTKLDLWWLFFMSLWFYGYSVPIYLILILSSICVNFFVGKRIAISRIKGSRKTARNWMIGGIVFNLALIFYFKYYDFFISNMNILFREDWALKHIALPLGISFFTFQQVSYVVDCYREKDVISYKFIEYAAYVTFFPQLVAGPIVMHSELVPQMCDKTKKKINYENMSLGLYALAMGLGKKVLLADNLSKVVNVGLGNLGALNQISAVVVMLSYTLQIYFDFSGYCDMALGMSKMFNIDLPINFNSPYKAKSVTDFWKRWHLTLGRFFTQYVYIPLGGSRKGKLRSYLNTMIIFLLSGIWHGANWTFILWGVIEAVFNVGEKVVRDLTKNKKKSLSKSVSWIKSMAGYMYMFIFINVTMMIFRAESVKQAVMFFKRLAIREGGIILAITEKVNDLIEVRLLYRLGLGKLISQYPYLPCVILLIILWLAVWFMKNTQEKMKCKKFGVVRSLVTIFLIVWSVISLSDVSEFLYFNF